MTVILFPWDRWHYQSIIIKIEHIDQQQRIWFPNYIAGLISFLNLIGPDLHFQCHCSYTVDKLCSLVQVTELFSQSTWLTVPNKWETVMNADLIFTVGWNLIIRRTVCGNWFLFDIFLNLFQFCCCLFQDFKTIPLWLKIRLPMRFPEISGNNPIQSFIWGIVQLKSDWPTVINPSDNEIISNNLHNQINWKFKVSFINFLTKTFNLTVLNPFKAVRINIDDVIEKD